MTEVGHTSSFRNSLRRWTAVYVARTLSILASLRVTVGYACILLAVSVALTRVGPRIRDLLASQMSTNLDNLGQGHLDTLVSSAFVDTSGDVFLWLPGLMCLLASGELIWRSSGLVIAFVVGHIGATLIVATGLLVAIEARWLPLSVTHATDVGVSYGAICVLGSMRSSIPVRWRPAWTGTWLGIAIPATLGADFTALGHVIALMLGLGLSHRLPAATRWTCSRAVLLAVGVTFAYIVLSGLTVSAPLAALSGALAAFFVSRLIAIFRPGDHAVTHTQYGCGRYASP